MAWCFTITIFIASCLLLAWLSSWLVKSLIQIAKYLRWREFVIAFFVMAFATSLPNFFVDFNAAFRGMPEISLGDIVGGNLIDLTLVAAIAVFFTRKGLSVESRMVQKSAIFTSGIAVLPLLLIGDSNLSRTDGLILIFSFGMYCWWLFSERVHFRKIYSHAKHEEIKSFKHFLKNLIIMVSLVILLLITSQIVVSSAKFFSSQLGISLSLVGILIVGLGNSFPEMYFSAVSARKEENWLVLGNLMGSVVVCTSLVLGMIALIFPFDIKDLSPFVTSRIFLIAAALFSLIFIYTGKRITKKEGLILLFIYISFLIFEILMPFVA